MANRSEVGSGKLTETKTRLRELKMTKLEDTDIRTILVTENLSENKRSRMKERNKIDKQRFETRHRT